MRRCIWCAEHTQAATLMFGRPFASTVGRPLTALLHAFVTARSALDARAHVKGELDSTPALLPRR